MLKKKNKYRSAQPAKFGEHSFMGLQHHKAAFASLLEVGKNNGGRTACRENFPSGLRFSVTCRLNLQV